MRTKTKSILIINRTFPPSLGATGRVACDLALHLRKAGHNVTILTTAKTDKIDKATRLQVIRIGCNQSPKTIKDYLKILRTIYKKSKSLPAHDVVISMTDPPLQILASQRIAKRMKARHIHWVMDLYPDLLPVIHGNNKQPWFYKIIRKMVYRAMKKSDRLIPISDCMARYLSHHGLHRQKMTVIENWPDKYLLEDDDEPKPLLNENKFRILYAGTIGMAHEFDTVLKAAKFLQKTEPDIEFVFTKRGKQADILQHNVQKMGLQNIQFIAPQSSKKLNALMASGDLHLVTMKQGAAGKLFPSKFYSALAAGRPILFIGPTSCDIHRKIIQHKIGATMRPGDSRILVNAIINYKNNPDDWFASCESAHDLIKNHTPLNEWQALIDRI